MERPRMQVTSVTIGAANPKALADFYARMLGWPVGAVDPPPADTNADAGWAQLRPPEGERGPTLNIELERQHVPAVWPSRPGEPLSQQHLDIWVEDLEGSVAWAVEQGARLADFQPQEHVRVLIDPEGHPFCLFL